MRVGVALSVGVLAGAIVAALSNAALYAPFDLGWPPNLTGFWGLLYGSFAAGLGFGLALMFFNRGAPRVSQMGRVIAALVLGLFGLAVLSWVVMWGVSPWSLEGAWIYPLAAIPLVAAGTLVRGSLRSAKTGATETTSKG